MKYAGTALLLLSTSFFPVSAAADGVPARGASFAAISAISIDREDFDAGQTDLAGSFCRAGLAHREQRPALLCRTAYQAALERKAHTLALDYAVIGCDKFRDASQCKVIAKLANLKENVARVGRKSPQEIASAAGSH